MTLLAPHKLGVAKRHLLIENADRAVGLAIERGAGIVAMINAGLLAVAHTQETRNWLLFCW